VKDEYFACVSTFYLFMAFSIYLIIPAVKRALAKIPVSLFVGGMSQWITDLVIILLRYDLIGLAMVLAISGQRIR